MIGRIHTRDEQGFLVWDEFPVLVWNRVGTGFRRETRPNLPVHLSVWVDEFLKKSFPTRRETRQNASRIHTLTGFQVEF